MATPTNGTGNLVDEFEESFQILMQVLAKEEENYNGFDRDDSRIDIDQASQKFLDVARQVESFFLQKRFVLSVLKPELIVKEEIADLRNEIIRKDELLKRHYEKISTWQKILSDEPNYPVGTQIAPPNPGTSGNVGPMLSPQQAGMFIQQGMNQRSSPFPGQPTSNIMNPLAFLEKTTSNIGRPEGPR